MENSQNISFDIVNNDYIFYNATTLSNEDISNVRIQYFISDYCNNIISDKITLDLNFKIYHLLR